MTTNAEIPAAPIRVVVCDDHALFAESLSEFLTHDGFEVVACTDTPEAALEVLSSGTEVDICLMDLSFPGSSSEEAIAAVAANFPSTRTVLLSGSWGSDARRAVVAGAVGFCQKTVSIAELTSALRRVHAGEVVLPSELLAELVRGGGDGDDLHAGTLTSRELDVLRHLAQGQSSAAIAADLGIQYVTVRSHIQNILVKLGVHSQLEAVAHAVARRMVPPPSRS